MVPTCATYDLQPVLVLKRSDLRKVSVDIPRLNVEDDGEASFDASYEICELIFNPNQLIDVQLKGINGQPFLVLTRQYLLLD